MITSLTKTQLSQYRNKLPNQSTLHNLDQKDTKINLDQKNTKINLYDNEKINLDQKDKKINLNDNEKIILNDNEKINKVSIQEKNINEIEKTHLSSDSHEYILQREVNVSQIKRNDFIIYPDGTFKITWDLIGMFFIIYQSLVVPYRLCFNSDSEGFLGYFEISQDFYFLIDILLNFNTAIHLEGILIISRKIILYEYLKLWFWLDIVSSFPFQLLFSVESYFNLQISNYKNTLTSTKLLRLLKILRVVRILRLFRLAKLQKILKNIERLIINDIIMLIIQLFKIILINLLISHWGACIYFYIGKSELEKKGRSWLLQANIQDQDKYLIYVSSVYYYVSTMATVGYGDITPVTSAEKIFCIVNELLAVGTFSYTIGAIQNIINIRSEKETKFEEKIEIVNFFLIRRKIDKSLKRKILIYMKYMLDYVVEEKLEENEVLDMLNKDLRDEIIVQINSRMLMHLAIFQNYEFCILLTSYIKIGYFNEKEIIFSKGSHSDRIYFISKGQISIYDNLTNLIYKNLKQDDSFGELGFFSNNARVASSSCYIFSVLKYVTKKDFKICLSKYKSTSEDAKKIYLKIKEHAKQLCMEINNNKYELLNIICYICDSPDHIAPYCKKLLKIEELFKQKYIDRNFKSEIEIKNIQEIIMKYHSEYENLNKLKINEQDLETK